MRVSGRGTDLNWLAFILMVVATLIAAGSGMQAASQDR